MSIKTIEPTPTEILIRYTVDPCGYFDLFDPAADYSHEEVKILLEEAARGEVCEGGYYQNKTFNGVECVGVVYPIHKDSYLSTRYERRAWPEAVAYSKQHGLEHGTGEWMDDEAWLPVERLVELMLEDYLEDCVRPVGVEAAPRSACLQYNTASGHTSSRTALTRLTVDPFGYFDIPDPAPHYSQEEVHALLEKAARREVCEGGYYKNETINGIQCVGLVYPIRKLSYLATRYERRAWSEAVAYCKKHGLEHDTGESLDDKAWLPVERLIELMLEDYWEDCVHPVGVEAAPRSACLQYDNAQQFPTTQKVPTYADVLAQLSPETRDRITHIAPME